MSTTRRIKRERETIEAMIRLYCRDEHGNEKAVCRSCERLIQVANRRIDRCPWADAKPTCSNCAVHCYRGTDREEMRQVMRSSGPKMPLAHPWLALMHVIDGGREATIAKLRQVRG